MGALQEELRSDGAQRGVYEGVWPDGTRRTIEYASVANFIPGRHLSIVREISPEAGPRQRRPDRGSA